jgi:hypothetical protein
MCFFFLTLSAAVFFAAFTSNLVLVLSYRKRIADCFVKREGFVKNSLFIHLLGVVSGSIVFGVLVVFTLWEFFFPPFKTGIVYLFFSTAAVLLLDYLLLKFLRYYTSEDISEYLSAKVLPLLVALIGAPLFAIYMYNHANIDQFVPTADPQSYWRALQNGYGRCPILGPFFALFKMWDYLIWSGSLLLERLNPRFFKVAALLLLFKGGISAWVLTRTVLGLKATVRRLKNLPPLRG